MAYSRVKITITDPAFFQAAQNRRESVRAWNGPYRLPHYIEKWDTSAGEAIVWFKVPKIPAGGSVTVRMYYGNPNATDKSSGELTFWFFYEFNKTDISDAWVILNNGGTVTPTTSYLLLEGSGTYRGYVRTASAFDLTNIPGVFEVYGAFGAASYSAILVIVEWDGTDNGNYDKPTNAYLWDTFDDTTHIQQILSGTLTNLTDEPALTNPTSYNVLSIAYDYTGSTIITMENYQSWGSYVGTITPTGYHYLGIGSREQTYKSYIKWARLRKFSKDVSVSIGPEQVSDIPDWAYYREITITNNGQADLYDFEVQLVLTSSNFDFAKAAVGGVDLRFVLEGVTQLPYYIETWDTTTPQADIWVVIDTETKVYIEANPSYQTDQSDPNVLNYPTSSLTVQSIKRYS